MIASNTAASAATHGMSVDMKQEYWKISEGNKEFQSTTPCRICDNKILPSEDCWATGDVDTGDEFYVCFKCKPRGEA